MNLLFRIVVLSLCVVSPTLFAPRDRAADNIESQLPHEEGDVCCICLHKEEPSDYVEPLDEDYQLLGNCRHFQHDRCINSVIARSPSIRGYHPRSLSRASRINMIKCPQCDADNKLWIRARKCDAHSLTFLLRSDVHGIVISFLSTWQNGHPLQLIDREITPPPYKDLSYVNQIIINHETIKYFFEQFDAHRGEFNSSDSYEVFVSNVIGQLIKEDFSSPADLYYSMPTEYLKKYRSVAHHFPVIKVRVSLDDEWLKVLNKEINTHHQLCRLLVDVENLAELKNIPEALRSLISGIRIQTLSPEELGEFHRYLDFTPLIDVVFR